MTNSGSDLVIHALHGFLGLSNDWSHFSEELAPSLEFRAHDLWSALRKLPKERNAFESWSEHFIDGLRAERGERRSRVLLGYSMGGRLAMHAAIKAPQLFSYLILVSAHPGLTAESERPARLANDQHWGSRFLNEEWDSIVLDWNDQPVLRPPPRELAPHAIELPRCEMDFDRRELVRALEVWSLARQGDLRQSLRSLEVPTLFITGEHDSKFAALARELSLGPHQKREVIEKAGHRVPWDQPEEFMKSLRAFLGR